MELKRLLGDELWSQVEAKINETNAKESDKLKHIRYADLSEGNYVSTLKFAGLEKEKKALEDKLSAANVELQTLKDNEAANIAAIAKRDGTIAELTKQAQDSSKTYALKAALSKAGVTDPDYVIYKQGGIDKFSFDESGEPADITELVTKLKSDMAHIFGGQSQYNPVAGNGGGAKNPFSAETLNLTEQGKLFKENPEQARALASAAGKTI